MTSGDTVLGLPGEKGPLSPSTSSWRKDSRWTLSLGAGAPASRWSALVGAGTALGSGILNAGFAGDSPFPNSPEMFCINGLGIWAEVRRQKGLEIGWGKH